MEFIFIRNSETKMNNQEMAVREDFIDEDQEANHEEYLQACMSIGLPEDEAEIMLEDMGL